MNNFFIDRIYSNNYRPAIAYTVRTIARHFINLLYNFLSVKLGNNIIVLIIRQMAGKGLPICHLLHLTSTQLKTYNIFKQYIVLTDTASLDNELKNVRRIG